MLSIIQSPSSYTLYLALDSFTTSIRLLVQVYRVPVIILFRFFRYVIYVCKRATPSYVDGL